MKKREPGCDMVSWYAPGELIRTASQVLQSSMFGRHSDYRLIEALAESGPGETPYDYRFHYKLDAEGQPVIDREDPRDEIWIDYVADVGDGWDSTYGVAYELAKLELIVAGKTAKHVTKRGDILIFGGDEVYPAAGRAAYEERLVAPYRAAFPHSLSEEPPHVFAIPGNHDWYDSLVCFTRLFCQRRSLAAWQSRQWRSYFALALPHGWWLLGLDLQLSSDIDWPQVKYFEKIAPQIQASDRIILCVAEPSWIYEKLYGKQDRLFSQENIRFLENDVLKGKNVVAYLAGDLHHYRRHQNKEGKQKIVAGGGGAFLHPTHRPKVEQLNDGYSLQSSFPAPEISKKLSFGNFSFFYRNPSFGLQPAILYMLTLYFYFPPNGRFRSATGDFWSAFLFDFTKPICLLWTLFIVFAYIVFTDTHFPKYRRLAGTIHALANLSLVSFYGWALIALRHWILPTPADPVLGNLWFLFDAFCLFGLGWVTGSFVVGLYLLISLNRWERHANEAFSSLRIPDWKNFLRLHIDPSGILTIYPIGIDRVPRRWTKSSEATGSEWLPDDSKATPPKLIEPPIQLA